MKPVYELGAAIDAASDEGNEELLRQLRKECESRLSNAEGEERVVLRYFQANTFGAIVQSESRNSDYLWNWEQPDGVQNLLLLRQAIAEEAFEDVNPVLECQIHTNLANRLNSLGRPVAANEQLLKVLDIEPRFAKALANRGNDIAFYATTLYDNGHEPILLSVALSLIDSSLDKDAIWESGDRDSLAPASMRKSEEIASYLDGVDYDENFDPNQWSLGDTREERAYRRAPHARLLTVEDAIRDGSWIVGPPELVTEKLMDLQDRWPGLERIHVNVTPMGTPLSMTLEQLELFATEVMPTFTKQAQAPVPAD